MTRLRFLASVAASAGILATAACAAGPASNDRYDNEYDQLAADCRERGGILSTTGAQTGDPARDNACKITGQPSGRVR